MGNKLWPAFLSLSNYPLAESVLLLDTSMKLYFALYIFSYLVFSFSWYLFLFLSRCLFSLHVNLFLLPSIMHQVREWSLNRFIPLLPDSISLFIKGLLSIPFVYFLLSGFCSMLETFHLGFLISALLGSIWWSLTGYSKKGLIRFLSPSQVHNSSWSLLVRDCHWEILNCATKT